MKFVISLILIVTYAQATPIQIYHENNSIEALMYKDILMNDYKIPEDLISVKGMKSCERIRVQGKLELCLKNNGDLYVVSVDSHFISESLKVFRHP